MDPNFKPLDTCDFETQRLLGALNVAADADDEVVSSDGKKHLANKPVPDQGVSQTRRNPLSRHLHPVELHRLQRQVKDKRN
ncbi:hypothetical protein DY000_02033141 [Brassica cretica]|uniref:Uncharacterized protein n=1 Tax=Brassica cretica TaxID=69181 RepID=A0ABQ7DJN1_BRACR|nr:hypothetical protein DY000_02033141 [Brassica cretica]